MRHLGCILSESKLLRDAVCRILNISGIPSSPIQHQFACVLEDRTFIRQYSLSTKKILHAGALEVLQQCERLNFNYIVPSAGLFVLVDLSRLLEKKRYCYERALFIYMFRECNVVMSPGEGSLAPPGYFRLCYACAPKGAVRVAFSRIAKITKEKLAVFAMHLCIDSTEQTETERFLSQCFDASEEQDKEANA